MPHVPTNTLDTVYMTDHNILSTINLIIIWVYIHTSTWTCVRIEHKS